MRGNRNGVLRSDSIALAEEISDDVRAMWKESHEAAAKLASDFAATGVEAKLKAAGKRWYALSPRRFDDGRLMAWLNPMEQHEYNYGWFSIADLEMWAQGKGPVIKKAASR